MSADNKREAAMLWKEAEMRVAAGILMMIGAVLGVTMLRALYGFIPGLLGWLPWFWFSFLFFGGIYTLKKKSWGLSLTSSILLLPMGTVLPFLAWVSVEAITPSDVGILTLFLVIGILPLIFVCLRKREWEG